MARSPGRIALSAFLLFVVSLPLVLSIARAQSLEEPPVVHAELSVPDAETQAEIDGCMGCHSKESEMGPVVQVGHLMKSPHASLGCKSCHSSITDAPHTPEMLKEKAACANCHPDISEQYAASVHARPDRMKGDHPNCITCHGAGDPHSVKLYATWTRQDKVDVCSKCHRELERMRRYGPNIHSVSSYENSFHGRALLKYGSQKTAICVDCHGSHGVRQPNDPKASTNTVHVADTCAKCHAGAGKNFAVSGANHMDLAIERQPVLSGVLTFFKVLVGGMASFLMLGVLLDLKRTLFSKNPPRAGRLVGTLVSLGFLSLVVAIGQATFGWPGGRVTTILGVSLLVGSVIIHKFIHRNDPKPTEIYDRFHRSIRWQHLLLVISFVTLILTGMPVRNPQTETLRRLYIGIGGLDVGRLVHRGAGLLLIGVFLFHVLELLWKWKKNGFKLSSWTMLPNRQDVMDFLSETRSYLGGEHVPPVYGRFHFRSKLDYFAEYWGIPLMGITGLMLWFPVAFGNWLPPIAIPIAFIAHSYEAVLAFIAIMTWHLYNSYFNLNHFAMSNPWNVGLVPHEVMQHVHPKEFEQVLQTSRVEPEEPKEPDFPTPESDPTE